MLRGHTFLLNSLLLWTSVSLSATSDTPLRTSSDQLKEASKDSWPIVLHDNRDGNSEFAKRRQEYAFGLGKRNPSNGLENDDLDYYNAPNDKRRSKEFSFGLGKRSPREFSFGLGKRGPREFSFGLGKRGPRDFSFGLGKRAPRDFSFGLGKRGPRDFSFGLGKRAPRDFSFGLGKRGPREFSFGLGKRGPREFSFGLGKRGPRDFSFGLGKRAPRDFSFGLGKRSPREFSFGLGKRSPREFSFGLGKRGPRDFSFGLGKRSPREFSFGLGKREYNPDYDNLLENEPYYETSDNQDLDEADKTQNSGYRRKREANLEDTFDYEDYDSSGNEDAEEDLALYYNQIDKTPGYIPFLDTVSNTDDINEILNEYKDSVNMYPVLGDKNLQKRGSNQKTKTSQNPFWRIFLRNPSKYGLIRRSYDFGLGKRSNTGDAVCTQHDGREQCKQKSKPYPRTYNFGLGKRAF